MKKEKLIAVLKSGNVRLWNRYRKWQRYFVAYSSDLRGSDLRGSDLSCSDLSYSDLRGSNLRGSNLNGSDLSCSDLRGSNLRGSNLNGSDLRGSNLDFSSWPLWCGSLKAKVDQKQIVQLLYHAAAPTMHSAIEIDAELKELFNSDSFKKIVNRFHLIGECPEFTGVK